MNTQEFNDKYGLTYDPVKAAEMFSGLDFSALEGNVNRNKDDVPHVADEEHDINIRKDDFPRVTNENREQYDQLRTAIETRQYETVQSLCEWGTPFTSEIVILAVNAKDTTALTIFLRNGWDIDMTLQLDRIPSALALTIDDSAMTAWLLDHGASPNTICEVDFTPLSLAVSRGPMSTIQAMFAAGGSIEHGELLHYATHRKLPDYLEVLELILSKKPPINDIMYQKRLDNYYMHRCLSLGTPLHEAAAHGRLDIAQILVDAGSNPLIRDSRGQTPLQVAEKLKHQEIVNYLQPITANATPPDCQFTAGKETTGSG